MKGLVGDPCWWEAWSPGLLPPPLNPALPPQWGVEPLMPLKLCSENDCDILLGLHTLFTGRLTFTDASVFLPLVLLQCWLD